MQVGANVFWAALGGGISTLIAVLSVEWLRRFLDRPLLKIELSPGFYSGGPEIDLKDPTQYGLYFVARNPHKVSVTVSAFGLAYKAKDLGSLEIPPRLSHPSPHEVAGGKSMEEWFPLPNLLSALREQGQKPSALKSVWFRSQSGKTFRSKIKASTIRAMERAFNAPTGCVG